jgi:hypothetical protein
MTATIEFDEFMVLGECALRFDGYTWCEANGLESGQMMNAYWDASTHDALLARPVEYQMAAFFLQQRSYRGGRSFPDGDMLRLWRRLFLTLGPLDVPAAYATRHHPRAVHEQNMPALRAAIAARLAADTSLDEPLVIEGEL